MADSNEEETRNLPPPTSLPLLLLPSPSSSPIIFPPKNHENLHISPQTHSFSLPSPTSLTDSSSSSSSLSSTFSIATSDDTSPPPSPAKNFTHSDVIPNSLGSWGFWGLWGLWDFGLGLVFAKVDGFLRFLRSFGFVRGLFLIFRSQIGLLLVFLYYRWRRRRSRRMGGGLGEGGDQHLFRVIREKDEVCLINHVMQD